MHKAFVIVPILGWAGVAALVHYARFPFPTRSEEGTVVLVHSRAADAPGRAAAGREPSRVMPPAWDRAALVRELQKELARVGCYEGEINGVWTSSSRQAMRAFTDRVNARLPTDKPDIILLNLVQGHRKKACGIACPAGQEDRAGRCVPSAIAATGSARQPQPAGGGVDPSTLAAAAALAAGMSQLDRSPAPPAAKPPPAKAASAPAAPPPGTIAREEPVPGVGVQDDKRKRAARRPKPQPTGLQALVKSVKNALGIR